MSAHQHESHPAIIKRLNRAAGHLHSIAKMIEDARDCAEVAQQLDAVEKAVASAKRALINDHIDHCLSHALDEQGVTRAIADFRAISRYL